MKWQTARRCCWQFLLQQAEHEADLSEGPARVCQHDVVRELSCTFQHESDFLGEGLGEPEQA
jgi:hypothetical protein